MIPGAPSVAASSGRVSGMYYPFTMTAGLLQQSPEMVTKGYSQSAMGSLSNQPIPGKTLTELSIAQMNGALISSFVFAGDETAFLSTAGLMINDIVHPMGLSSYSENGDLTRGIISLPPDTFVENQEYPMAIVAAPPAGLPVSARIMGVDESGEVVVSPLSSIGYVSPLPDLGSGMATLRAIVIEPDGSGYIEAFGADPSSLLTVLAGSRVWIDNVEYPFDTDWYVSDDDEVIAEWGAGNAPPLQADTEYHFRLE